MKKIQNWLQIFNNQPFVKFEKLILSLFINLPKLSLPIINFLITFGPYLVLLGGILSVLSILSVFSLTNVIYYSVSPFYNSLSYFLYFTVIGSVLSGILLILAYEDIKKLTIFGWRLVFWAININIIFSILSLNIFGSIIGALISWYILSQIYTRYR